MNTDQPVRRINKTVARRLAKFYERNGYVRTQNQLRKKNEGHRRYKKGDEVRVIAYSWEELALMQDLLQQAGFKPGRWFEKGAGYCQPIYGRDEVARFLQMVEDVLDV